MRLLLPGDSGLAPGSSLDLPDLARAYAAPARRWVRSNMVTTLDGAATGTDAKSGSINTEADHVVFDLLRALSHAVVIGAGTARDEGYRALTVADELRDLRAAHGLPQELGLVVVTRSGKVPPKIGKSLGRSGGPIVLATTRSAPGLADARRALGDDVLVCGDDEVDLSQMVAALRARGWDQLLSEGGPHLLGCLLSAGVVDELCYTVTPLVVGGDHPRTIGPDAGPTDLDLRVLVEQDGTLMGRWFTGRDVA